MLDRTSAQPYSPEMPVPPHVAALRAHIGHALLWLATARTVTVDDDGHVLLGRYPGPDTWTVPGGVIDPGEQPADAAVRECYEETGIIAVPEALTYTFSGTSQAPTNTGQ